MLTKTFLRKWSLFFLVFCYVSYSALTNPLKIYDLFFWFLSSYVFLGLGGAALGRSLAQIHLERKVTKRMEEDDISETEVVVRNLGLWPLFNLVIEDNIPYATPPERQKRLLLRSLGPKSREDLKYRAWCPQRGRYTVGPFFVYFFDPLGMFFFKKTYPVYSQTHIYPKTFAIQKFPRLAKGVAPWFGIQTSRVSGDEHEFYGVREYKSGDPIKKIHWLTSARKNKLIVKQFQQRVYYRATILFNLEKEKNYGFGRESVAEYTVKIAASVAKYFVEHDVSVELVAHAGEVCHIPFNRGPEHLEEILSFLSVAQAGSRTGLAQIFDEFSESVHSDSSLVVIMVDKDWEYLSTMMSIENRNVFLVPLVLVSSSFLGRSDKRNAIESAKMSLPEEFSSPPIFFACGDRLEEPFML
jgi:uncharacterized protein (DUF58 family)